MSTPREDGLAMPAEWAPHAATYMEWPTRLSLWGGLFEDAKRDYAEVANAIAAFEPVVMVANPTQTDEARQYLTSAVEILPMPIDDSWMRDNGPIFALSAGLNLYLCNGGAIVPTDGADTAEPVLAQIRAAFPERQVVPVPGRVLLQGGRGPHYITQQLPVGARIP